MGQRVVHTLSGYGSAGYRWECRVEGQPAAVQVSRLPTAPSPPRPEGAPESFSAEERFEILGLATGEAVVTFFLKRPWGDHPAEGREEILAVVVE